MTHIAIEFQEKICEILELFINISNNDTTNFTIFLITIDDGLWLMYTKSNISDNHT